MSAAPLAGEDAEAPLTLPGDAPALESVPEMKSAGQVFWMPAQRADCEESSGEFVMPLARGVELSHWM